MGAAAPTGWQQTRDPGSRLAAPEGAGLLPLAVATGAGNRPERGLITRGNDSNSPSRPAAPSPGPHMRMAAKPIQWDASALRFSQDHTSLAVECTNFDPPLSRLGADAHAPSAPVCSRPASTWPRTTVTTAIAATPSCPSVQPSHDLPRRTVGQDSEEEPRKEVPRLQGPKTARSQDPQAPRHPRGRTSLVQASSRSQGPKVPRPTGPKTTRPEDLPRGPMPQTHVDNNCRKYLAVCGNASEPLGYRARGTPARLGGSPD